ncbi:MAG: 23S rRNA (guanosine(2251)-2'-O)-methyltransferase RlmB [Elusimicrobiaceae bacterium]
MATIEVLYGVHPVTEALFSRRRNIIAVYVAEDRSGTEINKIMKLAKKRGAKLIRCDKHEIEQLARGRNHQGVAVKTEPLKVMKISDAIAFDSENKNAFWLGIDEMTDPQNLGAIIRSAACLGVTTVVLPGHRSVSITPAVQRVSAGAVERVNIVAGGNLNQAILRLKEEGFSIYGADMSGKSTTEMKYSLPAMLVIGSEDKGIRQKTGEHCDEIVSIPQAGGMNSLNASSAAAILLYDIAAKTGLCTKPRKKV